MAKKHPRHPCRGKVRHPHQRGAIIAMRKMNNAQLTSYKCPFCEGWHVGHSNRMWKIQARLDQLLGNPFKI